VDPVSQLRLGLSPILQVWERELEAEHPGMTISICDCPVGSGTDWNGHNIGIECMFNEAVPDSPDSLALLVSLKHLHKVPEIISADVVWGHGPIEASALPACIEFSPDQLAELLKRLPELFIAFKQAIGRGRPFA
jgi:hypothetical protein